MRLTSHALTRGLIVAGLALLTALPAGAATAAVKKKQPHAGGYIASTIRVKAKVAKRGGVRANEVLPASVDLRGYAPPVGDQGQIGACVAWSIAHGIMGYFANRTGGSGAPYAPLFLYMRNVAPGGAPSAGLNPDAVLANAQTAGVDTQDDYWQGTTNYQTPPTAGQIANAKNYRVSGWSRLFVGGNQGDAAKTVIQQSLASGNPVALGFPVYQDFMSLRTHSLYNTTTGSSLGGHMVAAFGYDSQGVWIRNSWGTWWGNSGDAKLSWAFITKVANGAYTVTGINTPATPVAMPPTVAALSVTKAAPGTPVTITGAGLASATGVAFGNAPATFSPVTANGTTKLVATAPAHAAGAVNVTVTNPSGTSAAGTASTFTYLPSAPTITKLSPSSVSIAGGSTVTLTGTDLTGATAVKVDGSSAAVKSNTGTSLTFVAPAHAAGAVNVTVTTPYGTSAAAQLTYVTPAAPVVSSLTPSSGYVNVATPVVITGSNFANASKVTAGDKTLTFTKVSETALKVSLPAHAAGTVAVRVTTPGGVSGATGDSTFTYRPLPVPAITAVTPATGATYLTTPVVLTGTDLGGVTKVTVDGKAVSFKKISATSVSVSLRPHAAATVDIVAIAPGGASATGAGAQFTYEAPPAPVVTQMSSSLGYTTMTNTVLLTGTDFLGASKVAAGGVSLRFKKVSDTQLKVTVPPQVAADLDLVVTAYGGTSEPVTYSVVVPPQPTIGSLSTTTGPTYASSLVSITGAGFIGVPKVMIGGKAVKVTKISETQLEVTAPARAAGDVGIVVTAAGGSSAPATFTYQAPAPPILVAMSATSGPTTRATTVTLTGAHLAAARKVLVAGISVAFTQVSDTELTVTMPTRLPGAVAVKVTTPGGLSNALTYTYVVS